MNLANHFRTTSWKHYKGYAQSKKNAGIQKKKKTVSRQKSRETHVSYLTKADRIPSLKEAVFLKRNVQPNTRYQDLAHQSGKKEGQAAVKAMKEFYFAFFAGY